MAFGNQPKDGGQIPMSSGYVPNTGFVAAQSSANTTTDAQGNQSAPLNLNLAQVGGMAAELANNDGMPLANLPAFVAGLYSGGGPLPASGVPLLASFDRPRSLQGKGTLSATINSTTTGDTLLTPGTPANCKSVVPGQLIQLSGTVVEYAYVSQSYTPSAAPATIPLQYPLVNGANTTVKWDSFNELGPQGTAMLPTGMGLQGLALESGSVYGNYYTACNADFDFSSPSKTMLMSAGIFNGTTVDRFRGNQDGTSIMNASGIGTTMTSADIVNYNARGAIFVLNMSSVGTGSVTLAIQGKEPVSGQYYPILTGVAITTNSVNVYRVYPGLTAVANTTVNDILPRRFRVQVTANNSNITTYTVACMFVL